MTDSHRDVEVRIELRDGWPAGPVVDTTFGYCPDQPYQITVTFAPRVGLSIVWVFGRDLLTAGMSDFAGLGDVRLWPDHRNHDWVVMALTGWEDDGLFWIPRWPVADFLRATFEMVPAGAEVFDADQLLAEIHQWQEQT